MTMNIRRIVTWIARAGLGHVRTARTILERLTPKNRRVVLWVSGIASLSCLVNGWFTGNYLAYGAGAAGLSYFALYLGGWSPPRKRREHELIATPQPAFAVHEEPPAEVEDLVEQMLKQGRYSLLLRPELIGNLTPDQVQRAWDLFEDRMSLVPEGELVVGRVGNALDEDESLDDEDLVSPGTVVRVEHFYLDRYPVTNRQFQAFVAAGGYEQMGIWDPEIWPGVLDFVDSTGVPGPRFWKHGRHASGEDHLPVVGISWYEAAAYARWVGKRLPTDPEWEKAGSWPVQLSATARPQRKYPWGESMDRGRCNLWGSGPNAPVAVADYAAGVSVGGVHQLVGNVWEWTTGNFGAWSYPSRDLILPVAMKSIRGGAFDTYYDNQATCQFQSGEDPVARKHNIGFRCAVSVCDLSLPGRVVASADFASDPSTRVAAEKVYA